MGDAQKHKKVYVKSFHGAKLQCMNDYEKPLMRGKPDHSIVHDGTNDINSEVLSKSIVESIVDLTVSLKAEGNDVSVSFKPKSDVFQRSLEERNLYVIHNTKKQSFRGGL